MMTMMLIVESHHLSIPPTNKVGTWQWRSAQKRGAMFGHQRGLFIPLLTLCKNGRSGLFRAWMHLDHACALGVTSLASGRAPTCGLLEGRSLETFPLSSNWRGFCHSQVASGSTATNAAASHESPPIASHGSPRVRIPISWDAFQAEIIARQELASLSSKSSQK